MKSTVTAFIFCLFSMIQIVNAQNADDLKTIPIRSIGPGAMSGRVTSITCAPNDPNTLYIGAASGGVWRSQNAGTTWDPIFDKAPTQSVGAVAVNPSNPDEIWVGTGEGNPRNSQNFGVGIFKSIDGGANWICMGLENTHSIHRVIMDPTKPNTIWVAAMGSTNGPNPDRGVFKSTDGGKNWRKVLFVNDLTGCAELVIDPRNPNKLVASMWEYQRWPWFFKSGGAGSGIYVSFDGGENWERRTEKDGLPAGELGRIGLAIAKSNPDVVYALVEAKDNALYKSTDGGKNWSKSADKNMGDRPFYYAELYVDPSNENTIYSVHSVITKSIDGGRSFDNWINYWRIHPDHHAFWIDPGNPKHLIDGNDGGINITYDGGESWRFAGNIPVGQFYHINVDNEIPYNIYGGLQDNGSWVGPSAVWKAGGLRNSEWDEVAFGDGFDVLPQRDDTRYCFAMSQGGEMSHIDRKTGAGRYIKPLHPDGTELRWNWNAALAQDPFNDHGIYFGSQFVHYSPDLGYTWHLLSPDLTTNDTSKLHQDKSGGLTLDATNAENHCTILAIAPSPVEKDVIWVSTDDGNLQITRDGGKTWSELHERMPGFPEKAWIPQIEVSIRNAGEAFVVVNNYRLNDWAPYLYHTTDYGRKWERLASEKNVTGFCLSVVQDPVEPSLLFLGTDQGLYFSLDYGKTWTHWSTESFPSVPVQDMKIQQREADLVLGTFGRAIWVLDNIAPLRAMAKEGSAVLAPPFKVFEPQTAVLANFASFSGSRFAASTEFYGDNKRPNARIPVWVKPEQKEDAEQKKSKEKKEADDKKPSEDKKPTRGGAGKKEKATVMVFDMAGDTLRQWKTELDTAFSYIYWGMDTKGVSFPRKMDRDRGDRDGQEPGGGPRVLPGKYLVKIQYKGQMDSCYLNVIDDPRQSESIEARRAEAFATREMYATIEKAKEAYERLAQAEKTIQLVESALINVPDSTKKEALKLGSALQDSISDLKEMFFTHKEEKGIQRNPETLNSSFYRALNYISNSNGAPNGTAQIAIREANKETEKIVSKVDALFEAQWKAYREKVDSIQFSLFEKG